MIGVMDNPTEGLTIDPELQRRVKLMLDTLSMLSPTLLPGVLEGNVARFVAGEIRDARAGERERAAKIAETYCRETRHGGHDCSLYYDCGELIATAIREIKDGK